MGAWGTGFAENDGALDFLGSVSDERKWTLVEEALAEFEDDDDHESGEEAAAALELVAAALGQPSADLEPDLAAWAAEHGDEARDLKALALRCVDILMNESELRDLWEEAEDDFEDWLAGVEDLKSRLTA